MGYLMAHVSKPLSCQVIHCSVCSCTHLILALNKTYPSIHYTHNSSKYPPFIFEPMIASKMWISASPVLWQWPFRGDDSEAASGSNVLNSQWPLTCLTFPTGQLPLTIADWSGFRALKMAPQLAGKNTADPWPKLLDLNKIFTNKICTTTSAASVYTLTCVFILDTFDQYHMDLRLVITNCSYIYNVW